MPFFDSMDFSDPKTQAALGALAGMASGFGKAAMPSRLPIGDGAMLGMAAEGMYGGMKGGASSAQDFAGKSLENTSKAISNDQALIVENMLRKALGKPELTAADIGGASMENRSPLFGIPSLNPKPKAPPATVDATQNQDGSYSVPPVGGDAAPGGDSGVGSALALKMLGFGTTEYTKARLAAELMPPGPAKTEALRAASKLAGIDQTVSQRAGESTSLYNPVTGQYEEKLRNPNLSQDLDYDPATHSAFPVKGALDALAKVEAVKQGAHGKREMDVAGFHNFLETGGLGAGAPEGGLKPNVQAMPDFAQRVAQIESGGNPDAANGSSTATGAHQFLEGTWLDHAKKVLPPEMTAGKTDAQILALRSDPQASAAVTNAYAQENGQKLSAAGIKNVGPSELYMAHHFGAEGAAAILKAPVNTPLAQILPPKVLAANPELQDATVADVYATARHAMKGVGGQQQQPQPVRSGNIGGVKSSIPDVSEAAKIPSSELYLKTRIPEWAKQEDEWADALPSNVTGEQRSLAIAHALKETQSGKWATEKAEVAAGLRAIGIKLPDDVLNDPAQVQTALKDNFQSTLAQIRAFTSRPAAVEVQLASKNFANPNLQPEANAKIISQVVGNMRWERALMNDWAVAKGQGWQDPQDFQRAWIEKNPVQKYIDAAEKDIGPLKGMKGAPAPHKISAADQAKITPENISHSAQQAGITEEAMKERLRKAGYAVP
jgi:hypothetical protein